MIAAAKFDITSLVQWSKSGDAVPQSSDAPQQTFSDSLLAASKASTETESTGGSNTGAGRRQKSATEETPAASVAADGVAVSAQTATAQTRPDQPVVLTQQAPASMANGASAQAMFEGVTRFNDASGEAGNGVLALPALKAPTASAGQMADASSRAAATQRGSSQTASVSRGAKEQSANAPIEASRQAGNGTSNADANRVQLAASHAVFDATATVAYNAGANAESNLAPETKGDVDQGSDSAAILGGFSMAARIAQAGNGSSSAGANGVRLAVSNARSDSSATTASNASFDSTPAVASNARADSSATSASNASANADSNPVQNTKSSAVQGSDLAAAVGGFAKAAQVAQAGNGTSNASANDVQSPVSNVTSDANATTAASTDANAISSQVQSAKGNAAKGSDSSTVLDGIAKPAGNADPVPVLRTAGNAEAVSSQANDVQASASQAASGFSQIASLTQESGRLATGAGIENAIPEIGATETHAPASDAGPSATAKGKDNASGHGDSVQAQSIVANTAPSSIPAAVPNAITNAPGSGSSAPVAHAALHASVKDAASNGASTEQTNAHAGAQVESAQAGDTSVPSGVAGQAAQVNQMGMGFTETMKPSASNVNPVSGTKAQDATGANGKDTANDVSGVKQHAQSTSDQPGSQSGSQSATTSGDQNQIVITTQGQNAAPAQTNFAAHTVVAGAATSVASTMTASAAPSTGAHAGSAGSGAPATGGAGSASTAAPQASQVVNSAKLIQSMGQSEMRVGMRSNEFGNISISTSSTKDSITAQISLEHSELAKELAAHLPEVQARLGGDQAVNVRIDMNGGTAGHGTGTSSSMSNGSADQSRGGRQQSSNAVQGYASNGMVERQSSAAVAAAATGYSIQDARLDIRV